MSGEIKNLILLKDRLRPDQTWTAAGVGRFQLPLSAHAIAMGGHVRVGLEDCVHISKGLLAESSAQIVEKIVRIASEMGREIATPDEARKLLHL